MAGVSANRGPVKKFSFSGNYFNIADEYSKKKILSYMQRKDANEKISSTDEKTDLLKRLLP